MRFGYRTRTFFLTLLAAAHKSQVRREKHYHICAIKLLVTDRLFIRSTHIHPKLPVWVDMRTTDSCYRRC